LGREGGLEMKKKRDLYSTPFYKIVGYERKLWGIRISLAFLIEDLDKKSILKEEALNELVKLNHDTMSLWFRFLKFRHKHEKELKGGKYEKEKNNS
jgi:hypothetical protein